MKKESKIITILVLLVLGFVFIFSYAKITGNANLNTDDDDNPIIPTPPEFTYLNARSSTLPNVNFENNFGGKNSDEFKQVYNLTNYYIIGNTNSTDYYFKNNTKESIFILKMYGKVLQIIHNSFILH